ncbi:MAG: MBOAT family protein [Gammaproteobacteria bacterium]|nr:MBOAT family protein [Gammaproteobacteria bacterium]
MLFNTLEFIVFLAVVLTMYGCCTSYLQRAMVILVSSIVFYAAWKPVYLILLIASLSINYLFYASLMRRRSRAVLVCAVTLNLLLLASCKYLVFLWESGSSFAVWTGVAGAHPVPAWLNWALPLGISFYTFHMLSVMIDVFRGDWTRRISFLSWSLYVTFFPHMVAGPILRASQLVEQIEQLGPLKLANLRLGAFLFIGGLLKKLLLADHLGPLANLVYSAPAGVTTGTAWLGTLAFSLQIYFDFSGYSEMAIGLAQMFGVNLPRNFLYPYISRNPREFWRRWHITLSRWLRDYLYVSLGGSRVSFVRNQCNLLLTMLLGGLWHGAGWTFIIWGLIHGLFLVGHRLLLQVFELFAIERHPRVATMLNLAGWPVTMLIVAFTWVFFRAKNFGDAWLISAAMLGWGPPVAANEVALRAFQCAIIGVGVVVALIEPLFVAWCARRDIVDVWWRRSPLLRGVVYATGVLVLIVFGGAPQKFIYFDF